MTLQSDFIAPIKEMRMTLKSDFIARYVCFDASAVALAWPGIEPAYKCYYGAEYDGEAGCDTEIIMNLCAHLFVMQSGSGNGPVQVAESKTVGSVSVSYGTGTDTPWTDFFKSSKYGQMFLQMTSARACGGYFV